MYATIPPSHNYKHIVGRGMVQQQSQSFARGGFPIIVVVRELATNAITPYIMGGGRNFSITFQSTQQQRDFIDLRRVNQVRLENGSPVGQCFAMNKALGTIQQEISFRLGTT